MKTHPVDSTLHACCRGIGGHVPGCASMSVADLLRLALADAPAGLHVAEDGWGDLAVFDEDHRLVIEDYTASTRAMPLVQLLLAAAPHLPDLLDALATNTDPTAAARRVRAAIEEAGR